MQRHRHHIKYFQQMCKLPFVSSKVELVHFSNQSSLQMTVEHVSMAEID